MWWLPHSLSLEVGRTVNELEYQTWVREQERKLRLESNPFPENSGIPDFSMAFQPIVDVLHGSTYAFEALVRSSTGQGAHSVLSRVPPAEFHLFDRSCRFKAMTEALRSGFLQQDSTRLNVNVNPNAAVKASSNIRFTCEEAVRIGFPLDRLVLELVEDDEICDVSQLKALADDYRVCGVQIAMDDFGAGYSGLKLLSKLKPDIIKLDMELVSQLDEDHTARTIVNAVVQACFELGITTIAEGVERYDQAMRLRDMGVVYQQGYYFARPGFEHFPQVSFALPEMIIGKPASAFGTAERLLRAS